MNDYTKLVEDLRDIEKTMFALGTSQINIDKISMHYAYDKRWGRTAADAADAIEELKKERDYYKQQYENRQRLIKSALGEEWT